MQAPKDPILQSMFPPPSAARLRRERMLPLMRVLRDLIAAESRVHAFTGSNAYLAGRLRCSVKTLQRLLKEMQVNDRAINARPMIEVVTAVPCKLGGRWYRTRTIFLVSAEADSAGALYVANLARRFGKTTTQSEEVFCGQLQCTPTQFRSWLAICCRRGWLEVELDERGRHKSITRVGAHIPAIKLPDRHAREERDGNGRIISCKSTWLPELPPPTPDGSASLLEYISRKQGVVMERDDDLAGHLGLRTRTLQRRIAQLVVEGRLYRYEADGGPERRRILSLRPLDTDQIRQLSGYIDCTNYIAARNSGDIGTIVGRTAERAMPEYCHVYVPKTKEELMLKIYAECEEKREIEARKSKYFKRRVARLRKEEPPLEVANTEPIKLSCREERAEDTLFIRKEARLEEMPEALFCDLASLRQQIKQADSELRSIQALPRMPHRDRDTDARLRSEVVERPATIKGELAALRRRLKVAEELVAAGVRPERYEGRPPPLGPDTVRDALAAARRAEEASVRAEVDLVVDAQEGKMVARVALVRAEFESLRSKPNSNPYRFGDEAPMREPSDSDIEEMVLLDDGASWADNPDASAKRIAGRLLEHCLLKDVIAAQEQRDIEAVSLELVDRLMTLGVKDTEVQGQQEVRSEVAARCVAADLAGRFDREDCLDAMGIAKQKRPFVSDAEKARFAAMILLRTAFGDPLQWPSPYTVAPAALDRRFCCCDRYVDPDTLRRWVPKPDAPSGEP